MQSFTKTFASWAIFSVAVTGGAMSLASLSKSSAVPPVPVARITVPAPAAIAVPAAPAAKPVAVDPAEKLRANLKYETVRFAGKTVQTLDEASRVLLVKAAAQAAGLHKVGLGFQDLYGIIEAETSWIPRTGSSKDGTPNLGLAQFEPRTAKAMGIEDPSDPVHAVFGAAMYIKQGAEWASAKLAGSKLPPAQYAAKLREGVSVHYNLSVKGRNKWDGSNTLELPIETQRHIANARAGAAEAAELSRVLNA